MKHAGRCLHEAARKFTAEYTKAGDGARLAMLVLHNDAKREYAYGPKSKVGTFTDALMAQAKKNGWTVISVKNDWKRVFAWEQ